MKHRIHGAYGERAKAHKKRRKVGGIVRRLRIRGKTRYLVIKPVYRLSLR
jgi:hypothetical protein